MIKTIIIFIVFLSLLMSCDTKTEKNTIDKKTNNKPCKHEQYSNCRINKFNYDYGGNKHYVELKYNKNNILEYATTGTAGAKRKILYEYNQNGNLKTIRIDSSAIVYHYDAKGRPIKLEGIGMIQTREFEYDDNNNIIVQKIIWANKIFSTMHYEYDTTGAPITITVTDTEGNQAELYNITYDDKINPFVNLGTFVNITELLLGYPVGNFKHNVTRIVKTYLKQTKYTINGKYKFPGDNDIDNITYKYNTAGYPVEILKQQNNKTAGVKIKYNCN